MKSLKLTLHAKAFEVMVTGEKDKEFRRSSQWIKSRLIDHEGNDKPYDIVIFTNGYGADKPSFTAVYKGYKQILIPKTYTYSNGLKISGLKTGDFQINLGPIIEIKNYAEAHYS